MNKKELVINRLQKDSSIFKIVPLTAKREWMNQTFDKFAYKCLPLTIANQYGYAVLSPADFTIDWWGGNDPEDVSFNIISKEESVRDILHSYFGGGTVTIHLDFIVKTPEGFSTYIRGIPNQTKQGIRPLDAIVETDWLTFTFTYNFLLTEPGTYSFKKDEPLFTFFPIERSVAEDFKLKEINIGEDEELLNNFIDYHEKRSIFNDNRQKGKTFQNFYRNGIRANGEKVSIKNHITNLIFGGKRDKINE